MNYTIPEIDYTRVGSCDIPVSTLNRYCWDFHFNIKEVLIILILANIIMLVLSKRDQITTGEVVYANMMGIGILLAYLVL